MINTKFEVYKIQRELNRSGIVVDFLRQETNKFKEPVGEPKKIGSILCIYHEQNGRIKISTGDTTQVRTKKVPMLLCLHSDVSQVNVQVGDQVKLNGKTFNVTGVINIQEWNLVADISLEVVDVGIPA